MSQLGDGFQALETQLDLPAEPIQFQYPRGTGFLGRKSGKYQHLFGAQPG
jgi:hypothetical protein